jgi:hypothetical protein
VKPEILRATQQIGTQVAESTYQATLERTSHHKVKPANVATVRAEVENPTAHKSDNTVLATSDLGEFTAAELSRWVATFPPQAQIAQRVKSAPDSLLPGFVKNFVRNELVVHAADSAKIGPDSSQLKQIRSLITSSLVNAWSALGIDPRMLAVSAKTKADREKLAHQRVDQVMKDLLAQKAQYVDVTQPVQAALREKYDYEINSDGVNRALLEAAKVRLHADSTKTSRQPPSVVPVPKKDTATNKDTAKR